MEQRVVRESGVDYDVHNAINELEQEMLEAAQALEFERAAVLRDEMKELKRALEEGGKKGSGGRAGKSKGKKKGKKAVRY